MKPIPYVAGVPVLGKLLDFSSDQLHFLQSIAADYGDIVHYRLLTNDSYQLNHPDYIQQVLVTQADKFEKSALDRAILRRALGDGLLITEGKFYRRQRKLVQPAFHSKRISAYADLMVDLTERLMDDWHDGAAIDVHEAMSTVTRRIVLKALFDTDETPETEEIAEAVDTINHISEDAYKRGFVYPEWLPMPSVRAGKRAVAQIDRLILGIIEERRQSGEDKGDLLSMLLLAQDEDDGAGMSDRQVRDEAVTLFVAGHETTANALSWALYLLARHPAVEAKLHAELDQALAGRAPTLSDLAQLPYTDRIIKEAMRLYPPAWMLNARTPLEDVTIDGYTLPRGSMIFISPYVMHHDARYFPEPDQFDPDRWTPAFEKALPRYAYFPFGGGPRVCIGNSFALMEARLVLATVAQHYTFSITDTIKPEPLVTLRPHGEIRATLKQRVALPAAAF